MKFVKILLNIPDGRGSITQKIEWNLVIDTVEDLLKYAKLDTELTFSAYMRTELKPDNSGFEVSHVNDTRIATVATLLNIKLNALSENEKMSPIVEVANLLDYKTRGMLDYINRYGAIRINQVGGYCGFDSYIETWNGEVLDTIIKEDAGFPIEADVLNAEALILENQGNVNKALTDGVETITGCEPKVITLMKEKDQSWLIKSITNAQTIAFESTFNDAEQLDKFMKLFLSLPKKRIIIRVYDYYKPRLTSHSLWEANNSKHEIIFL